MKDLFKERYLKAVESDKNLQVGDQARHLINPLKFQKGSFPKWSNVEAITEKKAHSYKLQSSDKYYHLQKSK